MEIGWKKVELGIIAVIDAATRLANTFTPSVWAQKFGINFADTGIQTLQKAMESRGVEVAGQILELERLQGQGGWTDVVSQQIEELRQRINESRSAEESLADETKKGTEQTKRNTEALTNFGKGLTGGKAATAGSSGRPDAVRETTAGGKDSAAFDILINRFRTLAGTGQQGPSAAESFERAARTIIAQTEAAGGYDTEKMREQMEAMLSRLGDKSKEGMKEAAQELTSGDGKSIGSITITVKSDNGETSGDVTGDTAFLSKLASTLQSVSTAV
jgi:prefoldin subunit 5